MDNIIGATNKKEAKKMAFKDTQRRVIIAGSSSFHNRELFNKKMELYFGENLPKAILNDGTAGTAQLAREWAKDHDIPVFVYHADWKQFGKFAGHNRALRMMENADAALIFYAEGDKASDILIEHANKRGVPVRIAKLIRKVPETVAAGTNIIADAIRKEEEKLIKQEVK